MAAATVQNSKPAPQSNNIHLRVTKAWQENVSSTPEAMKPNQLNVQPKISASEQSAINKFIESLHATQDKKDLFVLLSKQLRGLSATEHEKFIDGLLNTLKISEHPGDQTLLKEKFNPAYAMYYANSMFVTQINQDILSKFGQVSKDDDDNDDFDEI